MIRSDNAEETLALWADAATHLANPHGLPMVVLYWRLMGAHGLSAAFTVDGGHEACAVSAFILS